MQRLDWPDTGKDGTTLGGILAAHRDHVVKW
jgi:hypothetical protein